MSLSGSEIVTLMGVVVLLNALGLVAWRRGLVGRWYVVALGVSVVALLVDPMAFAGVPSGGAIGGMVLAVIGTGMWIRGRHHRRAVDAA